METLYEYLPPPFLSSLLIIMYRGPQLGLFVIRAQRLVTKNGNMPFSDCFQHTETGTIVAIFLGKTLNDIVSPFYFSINYIEAFSSPKN